MKSLLVINLLFWVCILHGFEASGQKWSSMEIVKRARSTVGSEGALSSVTTLQIGGRIEAVNSKVPDATIQIIARKPCSQRLELQVGDVVETTIVHGSKGCLMRTSLSGETSQMRLLNALERGRVEMSTRQFFSFYLPDLKHGERIDYKGIEPRRGVRCHRLDYIYENGFETTRFFSVNDGSLVSTVTDTDVESVEIGQREVDGIMFPEQVEYYEKGVLLHTIHLTHIDLNRPLPTGVFNIP